MTQDVWRWGLLSLTSGENDATVWWQTGGWKHRVLHSARVTDAIVKQPDLNVS